MTTADFIVGLTETPATSSGLLPSLGVAPARTGETIAGDAVARGPRPRLLLSAMPMLASVVIALGVSVATGISWTVAAPLVAGWALLAPGVRDGLRRPDRSDVLPVCRHSVTTFALLVVVLGSTGAPMELMLGLAITLSGATCAFVVAVAVLGRLAPTRVLIVGGQRDVPTAIARIARARSGSTVAGALLVDEPEDTASCVDGMDGSPVAYDVSSAAELVERWGVDCVAVLPSPELGPDAVRRLVWQLERSRVRLVVSMPVLGAVGPPRLSLGRLADAPFAGIASSRVPPAIALVKAATDRVVALVLLLLTGPTLAVLCMLVRLDSPGPAIYRQTRVGRDGRLFTILKLRTMRMHADTELADLLDLDEGNGVLFKIHGDPRVTRLGRVLRALSLDELPQLWNVVRGEMSLVGPRPALPCEVESYDDLARRRLAVRPGITGLWQVSGRSDLDWEQSVALDAHYVDNVGLSRDLLICLATVRAVASRKGAY